MFVEIEKKIGICSICKGVVVKKDHKVYCKKCGTIPKLKEIEMEDV